MTATATNEVREALGGPAFPKVESPSLRLGKFVRIGHAQKGEEVAKFVETASKYSRVPPFSFCDLPGAEFAIMKLMGRLIINQAGGVLENAGLCLHPHFGCPMIPGSAVKGLARHAAWTRWFEMGETEDDERETGEGKSGTEGPVRERVELALKIALTFGYPTGDACPKPEKMTRSKSTDYLDDFISSTIPRFEASPDGKKPSFAGTVSFLPALPIEKCPLAADIVTCHHPGYYRGDQPPRDDEKPIPNQFPVVEAGASFEFAVVPVRRSSTVSFDSGGTEPAITLPDFDPLKFALKCIRDGLEIDGAGAKTAAGYGWFEEDPVAREKVLREKEKREAEIRERRRLETMSSEDLAVHELGELDRQEFLECIKALPDKEEKEQLIVLRALIEKHRRIWEKDKKAKPKKKAGKRAIIVRETAEKVGFELP